MKIKQYLINYKNNLFSVNNEPLTKLSKLFLLVFLWFCFYVISTSLSQQGRTIDKPYQRFGSQCVSFSSTPIKVDIYNFRKNVSNPSKYYNRYSSFGTFDECVKLSSYYKKVYSKFKYKLDEIYSLQRTIRTQKNEIQKQESQYSNMLLEKIAKHSYDKSILMTNSDTIKSNIDLYKSKIYSLSRKIDKLENIKDEKVYKEFMSYLEKKAEFIQAEYSSYKRFYSLKVLASKYAFLLPLFIVVFFIYNFALKRGKYILSHLLINLLSVVGLYILFYLLEFVYSIIPHVFFGRLFALLYELNIIAFANYIAIAFFIVVFGFVIKFIQNRALKQKEIKNLQLINSYVKKGKCHKCGANKEKEYSFCPSCGDNLFCECENCKKPRITNSKFCQECGEK